MSGRCQNDGPGDTPDSCYKRAVIEQWQAWRLLKFLGIAVWTTGLAGALLSRSQPRRLWAVHGPATIGLGFTWVAGYGMAKLHGVSMAQPFVGVTILASLLTIHEACAIAERPRVLPWNVGALVATFASSIGAMVVRNPGTAHQIAAYGLPLLLGVVAFIVQTRKSAAHDYEPAAVFPSTRSWVVWLARLEGTSLIALLLIYMPLKYGAGIVLDGGQGWFGWVHGILALLWLQALWSGWRRLGWSWRLTGIGFVASLLPFGTFVFERFMPTAGTDTADSAGNP